MLCRIGIQLPPLQTKVNYQRHWKNGKTVKPRGKDVIGAANLKFSSVKNVPDIQRAFDMVHLADRN